MKTNEIIFYQFEDSESFSKRVVYAILALFFGILFMCCSFASESEEGWIPLLVLSGICYVLFIVCMFLSFWMCRRYVVSNRSVSISRGFATDIEFPADSITGVSMNSFWAWVSVATPTGRQVVYMSKNDTIYCFNALKEMIYDRQDAHEVIQNGTKKQAKTTTTHNNETASAPETQPKNKNSEPTIYTYKKSESQPQQSFIKRSYTDDELRALPLTSLTQLYASDKITKETYDRIRNEDEKAKDEAKKKEETQVLPCPECGEDLSFMGWDDLKQKQSCPFCGKEILF